MSQNGIDYDFLVTQLELWTREGKNAVVLAELRRLKLTKIPRTYCFRLAQIARRNSEPLLSLQMMNPIVRSPLILQEPPNSKEKIVYASSLTSLGFLTEAKQLLEEIDPADEPEALLYRSFALFGEWNYAKALPLLRRFVRAPGLSEYSRVVGQVNLAAALISEAEFVAADTLLREIIEYTQKNNYHLLLGNALEILAQSRIQEGDYAQALVLLDRAAGYLGSALGLYQFFVLKWQRISKLLMNPHSSVELAALNSLRHEAFKKGYWESVRDCDLFISVTQRDKSLLQFTLCGTPFRAFHKRAFRLWGEPVTLPKEMDWCPSEFQTRADTPSAPVVSILENLRDYHGMDLALHPTLSPLLDQLTRDFYRPTSLGDLFARLYPSEYFDPVHSPQRIYKAIYRLRGWFKQHGFQFSVRGRHNEFRLVSLDRQSSLRVPRQRRSKQSAFISQWHQAIGSKSFSAREFAQEFNVSERSAQLILKEALRSGKLARLGEGRARLYRFSNQRLSHSGTSA
jgi:tetratricopeptide (TPR) repeat protein